MLREALAPMPRSVPFVGREAELGELAARFEEGARLVTVLGPGGMGKTSVAVEHAARRVASGERTSVVFCDLSGVREGAADASALALAEGGGAPPSRYAAGIVDAMALACGAALRAGAEEAAVAQVGAALAARGEVVVVLDNVDGLADAAGALVLRWSAAAPESEWVVTSRARLGLVDEHVLELAPLEDGVALLVAAARRTANAFVLRAEDAPRAREIVTLLEAMPLALQMAGARLPLLGASALLEQLRDTRGAEGLRREVKGGPARHASLDAAVRGSFDALDEVERDVLAQLTVFRGGFTLASAEAVVVVNASPDARGVAGVIELLRARSLVRTRDAGAARFDLYAAVRSFVEREHAGPIAGAAARHEVYFVAAAERAAEMAHREAGARAWLLAERENVLAVATRVLGSGPVTARRAEPALRGIVALSPLLLARGSLASVAELVTPVVERTRDSGADPRLTARAMLLRAALQRERGEVRAALKDLLGAESIARALGDELLGADLRVELGRTLLDAREPAAARDHFDKATRAFGSLGARSREAHALAWSAVASEDRTQARALAERAVALAGAEPASRAPYLVVEARVRADLGDAPAAERALDDAIAVSAADRDARAEGSARWLLGLVLHDRGDLAGAEQTLASARDVFEVHGLDADAAMARGHLGLVAQERGRAAEAYALLADARDVAAREGREGERAYFEAQLAQPRGAGGAGGADGAGGAGGASGAARPSDAAASRDLAGAWAGGELLARLAARASSAARAREEPPAFPDDALVIGDRGGWFKAPGQGRVGLERRRSLALLLDRLAAERLAGGQTSTSAQLFLAAWPGEKAIPSAAAHRVRVAVATLRKMGLRDALLTLPEGYLLSPDVRLVRA